MAMLLNSGIQGDHHAADGGAHDGDEDGLDHAGEGGDGGLDLLVVEVGDLAEHGVEGARLSPSRTESWTSRTAREMTWLLTVSPTISSAWRMARPSGSGWPGCARTATGADLWNSGPATLTLSLNLSHW